MALSQQDIDEARKLLESKGLLQPQTSTTSIPTGQTNKDKFYASLKQPVQEAPQSVGVITEKKEPGLFSGAMKDTKIEAPKEASIVGKGAAAISNVVTEPFRQGAKLADMMTSGIQTFGKDIGEGLATLTPSYKGAVESTERLQDLRQKLADKIIELGKEGKDTSQLKKVYDQVKDSGYDPVKAIPVLEKSTAQLSGDALQAWTDIGTMFLPGSGKGMTTLSKLFKGTGTQMAISGTQELGRSLSEGQTDIGDIAKDVGVSAAIGGALNVGFNSISEFAAPWLKNKFSPKVKKDSDLLASRIIDAKGDPKKIRQVGQTLDIIDTKGIKTTDDLYRVVDDKVSVLGNTQDDILLQNKKLYTPADFSIKTKVGKKEIVENPVENAFDSLAKIYEDKGQKVEAAKILQAKEDFITNGINLKDTNDLARVLGVEAKSFSKAGDLSSSNLKQQLENNRTQLKTLVKENADNPLFAEIDSNLSSLLTSRKLLEDQKKNILKAERVANEPGVIGKVVGGAVKTADKVTGGTIRGTMGALFPANFSTNKYNVLDLEKMLSKNLKKFKEKATAGLPYKAIDAAQQIPEQLMTPIKRKLMSLPLKK